MCPPNRSNVPPESSRRTAERGEFFHFHVTTEYMTLKYSKYVRYWSWRWQGPGTTLTPARSARSFVLRYPNRPPRFRGGRGGRRARYQRGPFHGAQAGACTGQSSRFLAWHARPGNYDLRMVRRGPELDASGDQADTTYLHAVIF